MPRTRRVSYPVYDNEGQVIPGRSIQVVEDFTPEEEIEADADEARIAVKRAAVDVTRGRIEALRSRIADDTITAAEQREWLRLTNDIELVS